MNVTFHLVSSYPYTHLSLMGLYIFRPHYSYCHHRQIIYIPLYIILSYYYSRRWNWFLHFYCLYFFLELLLLYIIRIQYIIMSLPEPSLSGVSGSGSHRGSRIALLRDFNRTTISSVKLAIAHVIRRCMGCGGGWKWFAAVGLSLWTV